MPLYFRPSFAELSTDFAQWFLRAFIADIINFFLTGSILANFYDFNCVICVAEARCVVWETAADLFGSKAEMVRFKALKYGTPAGFKLVARDLRL